MSSTVYHKTKPPDVVLDLVSQTSWETFKGWRPAAVYVNILRAVKTYEVAGFTNDNGTPGWNLSELKWTLAPAVARELGRTEAPTKNRKNVIAFADQFFITMLATKNRPLVLNMWADGAIAKQAKADAHAENGERAVARAAAATVLQSVRRALLCRRELQQLRERAAARQKKVRIAMETMAKNIRKKMQKNKYVGADELEAMGEEEIFSKAAAILKEKNISIEGPKPTEHGAVFASRVHTKFMIFLTEM